MRGSSGFNIRSRVFFIFYVNDLPRATRLAESLLFADDTSIFYSNSDPSSVVSVTNDELTVSLWMKSNKLSVSIKKTKYIIFKPKQKSVHTNYPVLYDNDPLEKVPEVKFSGVYIDESLTWKSHISHVCKKISKSVGVIYRSRFLLQQKPKHRCIIP